MANNKEPLFKQMTVLAQDPAIGLVTRVEVPNEHIEPGPRGRRFQVIDYDAERQSFYGAHDISNDDFAKVTDASQLVGNAKFHAQNVYAIAASTLVLFERALGRHLNWGFHKNLSHQINIFPHAFRDANAFYSKKDQCLAFGYFSDNMQDNKTLFTCLSHDIVTHETTHAVLDGLRSQYVRPASPDQLAFHEAFADVVALLKVLSDKHLIHYAFQRAGNDERPIDEFLPVREAIRLLKQPNFLNGLAQSMGEGMDSMGRDALRRSIDLPPNAKYYEDYDRFLTPHDRGEILVAAVMLAHRRVWISRLCKKSRDQDQQVASWRIEEEGAKAARHLLQVLIRAIDYMPPVNITFRDFLSAVLTADLELVPDDSSYKYREQLRKSFAAFGIEPIETNKHLAKEEGCWNQTDKSQIMQPVWGNLSALQSDPEEIYRFLWLNRKALGLAPGIYTRVNSVRPVWRVGPDGFILRETVAEYYQLNKDMRYRDMVGKTEYIPDFVKNNPDLAVEVISGGTLIFDEFGQLKYHVYNRLFSKSQYIRLRMLWESEAFFRNTEFHDFSDLHRNRSIGQFSSPARETQR